MTKRPNKITSLSIAPLFAAFIAVIAATSTSIHAAEFHVEQRAFYVPEVFITDFSPGYCVAQVSVAGGNIEARKELYFRLADAIVQDATPENQRFKIAGADFVEFKLHYLISNQHCGIERQFDDVASTLKEGSADCTGDCRSLTASLKVVHNSGLVATAESVAQNPVPMHQNLAHGESVADCAISLPTNSDGIDDPIRQSLHSAIWKYGLPIMDVYQINDHYFLLVSRDCSQKVVLFKLLKEVLHRDNAQQLNEPDFRPDVAEYVFSQTGK